MTDWMDRAKCRPDDVPTDLFFGHDGHDADIAMKFCSDCPVKGACLEYAIDHRIDQGIWGGVSERERRRIIKVRNEQRRRDAHAVTMQTLMGRSA